MKNSKESLLEKIKEITARKDMKDLNASYPERIQAAKNLTNSRDRLAVNENLLATISDTIEANEAILNSAGLKRHTSQSLKAAMSRKRKGLQA